MRQIIFDSETTGLDPRQGHRIIELAAVEMVDRQLTGRQVHFYVNPEREIDAEATEVHGITLADLQDRPRFAAIAQEFIEFGRGAQWVAHNATFDIAFLDAEFARLGLPLAATYYTELVDTLLVAKELFPGKRNNLNALCERMGVNHAQRTLHGALLDAQLLAEVYLAMTRGQESLGIELTSVALALANGPLPPPGERPELLVLAPSEAELAAHEAYLDALEKEKKIQALWRRPAATAVTAAP